MQLFLEQVRHQYDVVVFDTPPLLVNADASLLAQEADLIVVAARLDRLTKNQARRARSVMLAARLNPTGVIVTGSPEEPDYGYGYRYGDAAKADGAAAAGEATSRAHA
jgi:Mrp family chromosome partitioning ATPase